MTYNEIKKIEFPEIKSGSDIYRSDLNGIYVNVLCPGNDEDNPSARNPMILHIKDGKYGQLYALDSEQELGEQLDSDDIHMLDELFQDASESHVSFKDCLDIQSARNNLINRLEERSHPITSEETEHVLAREIQNRSGQILGMFDQAVDKTISSAYNPKMMKNFANFNAYDSEAYMDGFINHTVCNLSGKSLNEFLKPEKKVLPDFDKPIYLNITPGSEEQRSVLSEYVSDYQLKNPISIEIRMNYTPADDVRYCSMHDYKVDTYNADTDTNGSSVIHKDNIHVCPTMRNFSNEPLYDIPLIITPEVEKLNLQTENDEKIEMEKPKIKLKIKKSNSSYDKLKSEIDKNESEEDDQNNPNGPKGPGE